MSLPKVVAPIFKYNPAWTRDNGEEFYIEVDTEVEVLQLNLTTGGMRVRYLDEGLDKTKVRTTDISIEHFFKDYEIVKRG